MATKNITLETITEQYLYGKKMAFVYEKVSKEEAEKFNLDTLWNYYHLEDMV